MNFLHHRFHKGGKNNNNWIYRWVNDGSFFIIILIGFTENATYSTVYNCFAYLHVFVLRTVYTVMANVSLLCKLTSVGCGSLRYELLVVYFILIFLSFYFNSIFFHFVLSIFGQRLDCMIGFYDLAGNVSCAISSLEGRKGWFKMVESRQQNLKTNQLIIPRNIWRIFTIKQARIRRVCQGLCWRDQVSSQGS